MQIMRETATGAPQSGTPITFDDTILTGEDGTYKPRNWVKIQE